MLDACTLIASPCSTWTRTLAAQTLTATHTHTLANALLTHQEQHTHKRTQPRMHTYRHHTHAIITCRCVLNSLQQQPARSSLLNGVFPVTKPVSRTSFSVVHQIKRVIDTQLYKAREAKVGHGGVLDSFANGVLGMWTKELRWLPQSPFFIY